MQLIVLADEYPIYAMNSMGTAQPIHHASNDPRIRPEWTNGMDADDEDSGIELVTVNNYQQRNINQLVSGLYYKSRNLSLSIKLTISVKLCAS